MDIAHSFKNLCFLYLILYECLANPGDLTVSKKPGTSYQIKIHFSIQTTKFLMKYNLLCFQIFDRLIISFTKHDY